MSSNDEKATALLDAARDLFNWAHELEWRSHDPFDLLRSPYLTRLQHKSPLAARLVVQIGRRGDKGIRRVLRVDEHEEAQAVADYLSAAAILARSGQSWAAEFVPKLARRLVAHGQTSGNRIAWGLNFPYASRFTNASAGTPNIYQTISGSRALLDAYAVTGTVEMIEQARMACSFILEELGRFEYQGRSWFRYWPGSDAPIVNVQASAASMLARAGELTGDERLLEEGRRAVETVLAVQRKDGSWPYSVDGRANFVDGFHTGFVLQALREYARIQPEQASQVQAAATRGFRFFEESLMTPEGMPRGLANGPVSLDSQNLAQCAQTLAVCSDEHHDLHIALNLWELGNPRRGPKSRPSLRWTLGPFVLLAAHLVAALRPDHRKQ